MEADIINAAWEAKDYAIVLSPIAAGFAGAFGAILASRISAKAQESTKQIDKDKDLSVKILDRKIQVFEDLYSAYGNFFSGKDHWIHKKEAGINEFKELMKNLTKIKSLTDKALLFAFRESERSHIVGTQNAAIDLRKFYVAWIRDERHPNCPTEIVFPSDQYTEWILDGHKKETKKLGDHYNNLVLSLPIDLTNRK